MWFNWFSFWLILLSLLFIHSLLTCTSSLVKSMQGFLDWIVFLSNCRTQVLFCLFFFQLYFENNFSQNPQSWSSFLRFSFISFASLELKLGLQPSRVNIWPDRSQRLFSRVHSPLSKHHLWQFSSSVVKNRLTVWVWMYFWILHSILTILS